MIYVVTRYFTDAQDNEHAYHEGDIYPRDGLKVSEARINDLMSGNNFQRVSLIKAVEKLPESPKKESKEISKDDSKDEKVVWVEEDINKMPFLKLKAVAKQNGIDVEDKKAAELKAELIEKLVEVE